jgi:glutathione synthase/RimK-type ligase-like ATP-grasp enzyme
LVLNRPSAMEPNHSKPYQAEQIRESGFRVPDTLITNHPQAALAFWQHHGDVIYKSISGVRSQVSRLKPEHSVRLDDLVWCPTQFQQYVSGQDYRVHVVGEHIFACEVSSGADDYRYADISESPILQAGYLPPNVRQRCRALALSLNLPLAGIDLRQTPQDEWYCFEVNPSPGFTYYQDATGQPISCAIAQLLSTQSKSVIPALSA